MKTSRLCCLCLALVRLRPSEGQVRVEPLPWLTAGGTLRFMLARRSPNNKPMVHFFSFYTMAGMKGHYESVCQNVKVW